MEKSKQSKLKASALFAGIEPAVLDRVLTEAAPICRKYQKNETVIPEGEPSCLFGLVLQGALAAQTIRMTGDMHIADVFEEGELAGLENAVSLKKTSPFSLVALETSEVLLFDAESLFATQAGGLIKDNVIRFLASDSIRKSRKLDIISLPGLRARILAYLQLMAAKNGSAAFHIHMNQERFAQYLSVNRSALSAELNAMRREGLIDFKRDLYTLKKVKLGLPFGVDELENR